MFHVYVVDFAEAGSPRRASSLLRASTSSPLSPVARSRYIGVAVASATTETPLTFIAVLPEVNPCDDMSSVTVPEALPTSSRV